MVRVKSRSEAIRCRVWTTSACCPLPWVVSGLWTRRGEEGMLGFSTAWRDVVGVSGTISVLSKDSRPYVQNAIWKMIFSKVALTLNSLLPETPRSGIHPSMSHFCSMIKNIKVDSLKLPIQEGALKKSLLSEDFPLIGWILGIWILVRGKLPRILFVSIMKHFDGGTGHCTDLKMNWQ